MTTYYALINTATHTGLAIATKRRTVATYAQQDHSISAVEIKESNDLEVVTVRGPEVIPFTLGEITRQCMVYAVATGAAMINDFITDDTAISNFR